MAGILKPGRLEFCKQDGKPGHCFCAQVFHLDGDSICAIEPTENEEDATAIAMLFSAAPTLLAAAEAALKFLEPQVCEASTTDEWEPNRICALLTAAIAEARGGKNAK